MTPPTVNAAMAVLEIGELPPAPLDASHAFHNRHLADACDVLEDDETQLLVVQMPLAGKDHDDWRRTLARDLARKYAPKRINVIAVRDSDSAEALLNYLLDAPGVTGQYCPTDD